MAHQGSRGLPSGGHSAPPPHCPDTCLSWVSWAQGHLFSVLAAPLQPSPAPSHPDSVPLPSFPLPSLPPYPLSSSPPTFLPVSVSPPLPGPPCQALH